ncbi:MAG: hypothetical protein KDJ31_11470 [Candidatus Competibacteraceae bacterium]|nr:hypothetical protein [Candidatus Competibacteraceae bacterium]
MLFIIQNRSFALTLPETAESDQTPVVRSLWQVIGDQQTYIDRLEEELWRMQGSPSRPQIEAQH